MMSMDALSKRSSLAFPDLFSTDTSYPILMPDDEDLVKLKQGLTTLGELKLLVAHQLAS